MRLHRRIVVLLLAYALIAVVFFAIFPRYLDAAMYLSPLVCVQPSLVAVWVVFGGRPMPWRLVAVAGLGAGGVSMAAALGWVEGNVAHETGCYAISAFAPAAVLLSGLRLFGFECARRSRRNAASWAWGRFQFTLSAMLQWTAACAILLSLGSWFARDAASVPYFRAANIILLISGTITAVAVAVAFIVVLREPRFTQRHLLFALGPSLTFFGFVLTRAEAVALGYVVYLACGSATAAAVSFRFLCHDLCVVRRRRPVARDAEPEEDGPNIEEEPA